MRPSLRLAVSVLLLVAVAFTAMVLVGIGGDVAADTTPHATMIILKDTIHPSTITGQAP